MCVCVYKVEYWDGGMFCVWKNLIDIFWYKNMWWKSNFKEMLILFWCVLLENKIWYLYLKIFGVGEGSFIKLCIECI